MSKRNTKPNLFAVVNLLFRLGLRYPLAWLVLILSVLAGYGYEVKVARPPMLYQGAPEAVDGKNLDTWYRILRNHGFILGYSDLRGNPLWVEYQLTPLPKGKSLKRPDRFESDWRAINRTSHDSYRNSGYDRGHMAPNYAISRLYGKAGQADSFLMTNITPQKAKLNQQVWQRLEEAEVKQFTKRFGKLWVITGPVFTGSVERLPSDWKVEIPDAFYKIYLTEAAPGKSPEALAFLIPQTVSGREALSEFVTSIDHIEALTGLDFFSRLDDRIEAPLESGIRTEGWKLPTIKR